MSEWQKVNLGDCCEITSSKRIFFSEYVESGIPFYRSKEIIEKGKGEEISHPLYISKEKYDEIKGKYGVPQKGDLLLTAVGSLGIPFVVKDDSPFYFKDGNLVWLKHFQDIDSIFLYYWIKSENGYNALYNIAIGSAQKALTIAAIKGYEIPLPPLQTQHRIANILSRYDSLIENYQKQIKLLEEAAQRLYKEWFVDLHFPGHENTKIVDGVPEGWEKKPALDFFEMSIGRTPPRTQKQWFTKGSNGIPWVSISDMKDTMFVQETAEELTQDACENYNIKVIPKGTILLSFKLTVGRVAFAGADVCTNEAIAHFQKEGDEWKAYTLMYLRNYNYDSLGNTSGISKAVNSTIIKNMPFVMPCTAILQEFSQRVLPFIKQTENLQSQLRLLTEARDRLLPKLMSGEITLEARAEKEVLLATPYKGGDEAK